MKYRVVYWNFGRQIESARTKREADRIVREVGYSGPVLLQQRRGDTWETIERWEQAAAVQS